MTGVLVATAESSLVDGRLPSWVDQLQPASFREVPFHVDSIEWTAGDNVVLREYPFQDLPTVFRMGRAANELRFSAYVIGDDYHLQRDALMRALTGEGELVHPTAGRLRAYCAGKYSVREAPTSEGGMARFDLRFVLAEARRYPAAQPTTQQAVTAKAAEAKAAAADAFAGSWGTASKPGWVVDKAVGRLQEVLAGVVGPIRTAAQTVNGWQAQVNAAYRAAVDGLDSLLRAPRQLASAVVELYRLPNDLASAAARDFQGAFRWAFKLQDQLPAKAFEARVVPPVGAGLVMYGTGIASALVPTTPAQRQLAGLTAASDRLVETLAFAAWAEAVAAMDLANHDEAMALRRQCVDQVTRLLQAASTDAAPEAVPATAWHDAIMALQSAVLADLQARGRDLVRLTTYTPQSWQPVWCVSYRLFGTGAYADEILAMNPHIEHPLLVPPGQPLRIVRHG